MVVGNGMVAKRFASYQANDDVIIFASGVSNSKNMDMRSYDRETDMVKETLAANPGKTFVYFSTCSLYDREETGSLYCHHKIKVENIIQATAPGYIIFRVSNIVGRSSNPNTILNFFYYHLAHKINFDLWSKTSRNLIDIDDMFRITDHIVQQKLYPNQVVNIANPKNNTVKEIIETLESTLGLQGNYISIPKGSDFTIDISLISPVIQELGVSFGSNYLQDLIKKYYPHT